MCVAKQSGDQAPNRRLTTGEKKNKTKQSKAKQKAINSKSVQHVIYHDDEDTAIAAVTDVKAGEALKCELWMSDSANSLKSCLEHDRPG